MEIKNVSAVYFSPGGSTALRAKRVAAGLAEDFAAHDFTSRPERLGFAEGELVVFAAPVFGGRIPGVFADFLGSVEGAGAAAVCLAVYGGRDYDDALLELADRVRERGFRVVARAGHGGVALHAVTFHQAHPQAPGGGMVHGWVPSFAAYSHYTRRRGRVQDGCGLCLTCGIFVI